MHTNLIKIIYILIIMVILIIFINLIYKKFFQIKKQIHIQFFKNILKIIIILIGFYFIGMQLDIFNNLSKSLLTSSSLLVVVLGFAFQTSLEDFIAGVLISIFKPFNIDDRITLTNENISGYIENITIRHTVVKTFQNSRLIIPNSIMNKAIIENNHMIENKSSNFIDVTITYNSNLEVAKSIISNTIKKHPKVIDNRNLIEKIEENTEIIVYVRALSELGISLRANVWTNNVDENFLTCSEIREIILKEFKKKNIQIAYPQRVIHDTNQIY